MVHCVVGLLGVRSGAVREEAADDRGDGRDEGEDDERLGLPGGCLSPFRRHEWMVRRQGRQEGQDGSNHTSPSIGSVGCEALTTTVVRASTRSSVIFAFVTAERPTGTLM